MRLNGITWWVFGTMAVGAALMWWFVRVELGMKDPVIDMRLIARPTVWPVILTSGLFGVSVLGAQGPLSTFAATDPAEVGYGLGLDSAHRSYLIGAYVFSLLVGAALFARVLAQPRAAARADGGLVDGRRWLPVARAVPRLGA